MRPDRRFIIASRASKLAMVQARYVMVELEKFYPSLGFEIKTIKTTGDKILNVPLDKIGGKGLFTKEIEDALISGEADFAVHSMKDLPTDTPCTLKIACVTKREDPRDTLISGGGLDLKSIPGRSIIGTSSLRRRAQVLNIRRDVEIRDLRGNLDTRLKKLNDGLYDAIIVALAGIKRLGLKPKMSIIPVSDILPQAGQGALAIETRGDDREAETMAGKLNDPDSYISAGAEREALSALGGGCQTPIGIYANVENSGIHIRAGVFSPDGKTAVKDEVRGDKEDYVLLARNLAEKLLKKGAKEILCPNQKCI